MFQKHKIIRWFFNRLYRIRLPEMVQYWKTGDVARAKLVVLPDGSYAMLIEGEKYPLYGFPRGPVLFGPLARLKHLAKSLLFNQVWKMLEEKKTIEEIVNYIFGAAIPVLLEEITKIKYDMFPPERLCPSVRELWRAFTVVENTIENKKLREDLKTLKEGFTFFLQEDDAYRFRAQWIAKYINPKNPFRKFYYLVRRKPYSFKEELKTVLDFLGHAEITPDMRGRSKLIGRIFLLILEIPELENLIEQLVKEINWKKLYLSPADKYYFRGKYFKVDLENFDY